jgi:hypothetical protein
MIPGTKVGKVTGTSETELPRPQDLLKISDDADTAKALEALERQRREQVTRHR